MHPAKPVWDDVQCLDIPAIFRKINHVSCDDEQWLEVYDHQLPGIDTEGWEALGTDQHNIPTCIRWSNRARTSRDENTRPKSSIDPQRIHDVLTFRLSEGEPGVLDFNSIFELEHIGLTNSLCKGLVKLMLRFEINQHVVIALALDHILCLSDKVLENDPLMALIRVSYRSIEPRKQADLDVALSELFSKLVH